MSARHALSCRESPISDAWIAIASTLAKRYPGFGALTASRPLVSVLGMIWLRCGKVWDFGWHWHWRRLHADDWPMFRDGRNSSAFRLATLTLNVDWLCGEAY
jgi:hypothetical protein